ncbi:hypothetical protein RIF29_09381 [Crotalaria pallida]|uniref:Myosin motor domain-containing protein n=1 Tax=Crotalaria pallida TaxID=3830 RepID=A0AAN9ILM5_CROPI
MVLAFFFLLVGKTGYDPVFFLVGLNQKLLIATYILHSHFYPLIWSFSVFPKSTHETFANKLYQTFKTHKRFIKPKLSRTDFTVSHYAGEVPYQSNQFLDKNKDYVVPEHRDLLGASKCPFVAGLFPPLPEESSKSSKFSSIGSRFKLPLQQLMETLNSTEPHYIRCVKPNNLLKPAIFENTNIMQQLRCGGVLEAIRISCAGYPTRHPFFEFVNRFGLLAPEAMEANYDEKTVCKKILDKMGLKGYQIGKTKVFLRAGQMAELDGRRAQVLGIAAKSIQRRIRTHQARKHYLALRKKTIYVQSRWRGRLACKRYEGMRREDAAKKIQKNVRRYEARKAYKELHVAALTFQTALRAIAARKEFRFRKQTKASIIIQARWRCHKAAVYYKRLKRGAIVTQCRWRGRVARRELRKLKMMQHIQPVARGKRTKGGVADVDAAARIFTTGMKLCVWWIYTCKQKFGPNESNMLIRNEGFDRA